MMWTEYTDTLRQIRILSATLLPTHSPTASYNPQEVLRMLAFRLSAHAEIEGFIELCASRLADHYAQLNSHNRLSAKTRRTLLHHSDMKKEYPPRSLTSPLPYNASAKIKGILNTQIDIIEGNNGLSQKDVLKLFVPLGIELSFFETSWLDSMDTLARRRGEVAHNSWLNPGRQPDPQDERSVLVYPLFGMRRLIAELNRLTALA